MPRLRRPSLLVTIAALALSVGPCLSPARAIEVCRENFLGQIACSGQPVRGLPPMIPYKSTRNGLDRVQDRVDPDNNRIFSPERTNSFGDTILLEDELPPSRPKVLRRDSLGNLIP